MPLLGQVRSSSWTTPPRPEPWTETCSWKQSCSEYGTCRTSAPACTQIWPSTANGGVRLGRRPACSVARTMTLVSPNGARANAAGSTLTSTPGERYSCWTSIVTASLVAACERMRSVRVSTVSGPSGSTRPNAIRDGLANNVAVAAANASRRPAP